MYGLRYAFIIQFSELEELRVLNYGTHSSVPNCRRGELNSIFGQMSPPISLYEVQLLKKLDLRKTSPLFMDLDKFHQPTPAITTPYNQA